MYFVSRLKDSTAYTIVVERPVPVGSDILRDEVIVLDSDKDPDNAMRLRRIEVWLEEKQDTIVFIEQPEAGGLDHRRDLPRPLADRALLQGD